MYKNDFMEHKKILSFILPVYNEEKNLIHVYEDLISSLEQYVDKYDYEIVFIDDGSHDASWQIIQKLAQQDIHVHGILFSRNFWQQMALEAWLIESRWNAVITMDADGQHPPNIIWEFIQKWEEGFQVVNTKRLDTQNISFFKKITSALFYTFINTISGFKIEPASSDFRLLDRNVVDFLNTLKESPKFYRGILAWAWFQTTIIPFHAAKRWGGKSGYSLARMYDLALLGMTSCSLRPLKMIIVFGVLMLCGATWILTITLITKFMQSTYFSSAALWWSFILVNTSVIVIILWIIGIYNANILSAISSRPTYIVKERK